MLYAQFQFGAALPWNIEACGCV